MVPRYEIEMDEPTDCGRCPCFSESYTGGLCRLWVDERGIRGRGVETPDGTEFPRPDWCPLVEAGDGADEPYLTPCEDVELRIVGGVHEIWL